MNKCSCKICRLPPRLKHSMVARLFTGIIINSYSETMLREWVDGGEWNG